MRIKYEFAKSLPDSNKSRTAREREDSDMTDQKVETEILASHLRELQEVPFEDRPEFIRKGIRKLTRKQRLLMSQMVEKFFKDE